MWRGNEDPVLSHSFYSFFVREDNLVFAAMDPYLQLSLMQKVSEDSQWIYKGTAVARKQHKKEPWFSFSFPI